MASGPIYFFQHASTTITDAPAADIEAEKARIAAAQEKAAEQLNALADKARAEAGDETAILFETHAMFVKDVTRRILNNLMGVTEGGHQL